jgi:hypothetical protein
MRGPFQIALPRGAKVEGAGSSGKWIAARGVNLISRPAKSFYKMAYDRPTFWLSDEIKD